MLKYQRIAEDMEQYIVDNELRQGDKLPVLEDLRKKYEVSKSTITKALELLEMKGIIYQVRGSGIFVRRHRRKGYINLDENQGFRSGLDDFQLTSEILGLEVVTPSEEVMANLSISAEEPVYQVKRLRFIHGQPLCIEESYYKKSVVPFLNEQIVSESIFTYLREGLKLKIGFSDNFFHIRKLDEDEAELLSLDAGDPALYYESVYHLPNGEPFDYSKLVYNYQEAQFYLQINSFS
ncbi:GntR family transcriptional regulator [Salinicoccus roseus]|uniref:GntR family transcriptional regulator n=1 Tax=Salinicoccus roseus TaxID=45670 RepID=UPI0022FFE932|nr:GntR family transcriptional regulator [Salinicoccus roseus]